MEGKEGVIAAIFIVAFFYLTSQIDRIYCVLTFFCSNIFLFSRFPVCQLRLLGQILF